MTPPRHSRRSVVGLVERFEETLLLVADLVGLQHLLSPDSNVAPLVAAAGVGAPKRTPLGCSGPVQCAELVARIAPVDLGIYQETKRSFNERVEGAGPRFAERVELLRAARRSVAAVRPRKWTAKRKGITKNASHFLGRVAGERPKLDCLGLLAGESPEAAELCAVVLADAQYTLRWRAPMSERELSLSSRRR